MKTKVLKTVLPIVVMVFAIGLAFATKTENTSTPGYYMDPISGVEEVPGGVDCFTEGDDFCIFDKKFEVFADQGLTIRLYERK